MSAKYTEAERLAVFWEKVNCDGPTRPHMDTPCWVWLGSLSHGYGQMGVGGGRMKRTHRLSYELHNGPIPEGLLVCHECDVRACVNPAHFFLGTCADNNEDMRQKGRQSRGEKAPCVVLTESQVREIRARHASHSVGARALSREFGVCRSNVYAILSRETWAHVS